MDAVHATESSRLVDRADSKKRQVCRPSEAGLRLVLGGDRAQVDPVPRPQGPEPHDALIAEVKEVIPVIEWAA
jgi:hypothetical protein